MVAGGRASMASAAQQYKKMGAEFLEHRRREVL
jgi:hypothetical protein